MFEMVPFQGGVSLQKMRKEMEDMWGRLFSPPGAIAKVPAIDFVPAINLKETDEAFEISVEVAGLKPEEIEVALTGDILSIKGEKKEEKEETKGDYHLTERSFGKFSRSFRLPAKVDRAKLEARCKDGVLSLSLPKDAKEDITKIEVAGG
jgi:HSP20 family protein